MKKNIFRFRLWAFFVFFLLSASGASAGVITLQMRMTISASAHQANVVITVRNTGTDAAHDLRAVVFMAGCRAESDIQSLLAVRQNAIFSLNIDVPPETRGAFPVIGKIVFHDGARQAFEALSGTTFHCGLKTDSKLQVSTGKLSLSMAGILPVKIRNTSDRRRQCRVTLYLPRAVFTPKDRQTLFLGPGEAKILEFPILSRENIDSSYPVFCTVEYDESKKHYAQTVRGTIQIEKDQNGFEKTRWYWLAGLAPLFVILLTACRAEGRGQRAEGRGQRTEGRGQRAEGRGQ
ncbi:MAG: hypothetical protein PHP23_14015, partial [Desulfobacterales bacterium]|nr:hypothetical protein [Desulfobacterales bacterium]